MRNLINLLVSIYKTVGKLDTLTYEDYYRVQARIAKQIKDMSTHLGITDRQIPYPNTSLKYIKNG